MHGQLILVLFESELQDMLSEAARDEHSVRLEGRRDGIKVLFELSCDGGSLAERFLNRKSAPVVWSVLW